MSASPICFDQYHIVIFLFLRDVLVFISYGYHSDAFSFSIICLVNTVLDFWDYLYYNYISLPCSPSKLSHKPFSTFLKIVASFCFDHYECPSVYVYTCTVLNMSFQIILLLWMFSGLTFGTRQSIGVFFPEKHHLYCSQFFSVVYNTFCRTEDSWAFPIQFGMFIGVVLVQFKFVQSYQWDFTHVASDTTRIYNLTSNSLILCFL